MWHDSASWNRFYFWNTVMVGWTHEFVLIPNNSINCIIKPAIFIRWKFCMIDRIQNKKTSVLPLRWALKWHIFFLNSYKFGNSVIETITSIDSDNINAYRYTVGRSLMSTNVQHFSIQHPLDFLHGKFRFVCRIKTDHANYWHLFDQITQRFLSHGTNQMDQKTQSRTRELICNKSKICIIP